MFCDCSFTRQAQTFCSEEEELYVSLSDVACIALTWFFFSSIKNFLAEAEKADKESKH